MRFLISAAPGPDYDPAAQAAKPFDPEMFAAYMKFNEDMHNAGILVASEGLNPGVVGARVGVVGGKRQVLDGPFVESKELVGGFYIIDVASREEAISWALRCPTGFGADDVLTLHPMTGANDLPPEIRQMIVDAAPNWSAAWTVGRK